MIAAFIYGALLAFGLIIPLGVQNIFIFNQGATQHHFLHALPSVLTAFACDVILIVCAVLGVSLIVFTVPWIKSIIFVAGIIFLGYMGWLSWNTQPQSKHARGPLSVRNQIGFAASASLLNPHALLDTIGVIGTNSLHFMGKEKLAFTLACIIISFIWFLFLSIAGHVFTKLDRAGVGEVLISKVSALIMWMTGSYLGWQLIFN